MLKTSEKLRDKNCKLKYLINVSRIVIVISNNFIPYFKFSRYRAALNQTSLKQNNSVLKTKEMKLHWNVAWVSALNVCTLCAVIQVVWISLLWTAAQATRITLASVWVWNYVVSWWSWGDCGAGGKMCFSTEHTVPHEMSLSKTLSPKLLLTVRPECCVGARCHTQPFRVCACQWVNEWPYPCKALWINGDRVVTSRPFRWTP